MAIVRGHCDDTVSVLLQGGDQVSPEVVEVGSPARIRHLVRQSDLRHRLRLGAGSLRQKATQPMARDPGRRSLSNHRGRDGLHAPGRSAGPDPRWLRRARSFIRSSIFNLCAHSGHVPQIRDRGVAPGCNGRDEEPACHRRPVRRPCGHALLFIRCRLDRHDDEEL